MSIALCTVPDRSMENTKVTIAKGAKLPHNQYLLEPVYRSSLVLRSVDLTSTPKSNYYDVDLEGQEIYASNENEKNLLANEPVKSSRRRRRCSLCCCYSFYIICILLLSLGIVVLKLVPKDPAVSLGDVHITEFTYNASASPNGPQITAKLTFELNVTNRNSHADAIYREINLTLSYRDESLGSVQRLPEFDLFEQKKKMTTTLSLELPETVTTIQSQTDAASLKTDVANSSVQLGLTGIVKGTHKVLGVKVKRFDISVRCYFYVKPGDGSSQAEPIPTSSSCYYVA